MENHFGRLGIMATTCLAIVAPATVQAQAKQLSINTQPVGLAIAMLARQANVQIVAASNLVQSKRSRAVRGVLTVPDALTRMLDGTGLIARQIGQNTYVVVEANSSSSRSKPALIPAASGAAVVSGTQAAGAAEPPKAYPSEAASSSPELSAPSGLEEIVVTARRSSENAQRVPIAITTISARRLQDLSVRDILEIQKVTPGLFIASQGLGGRAKLEIRGQAEADSRLTTDGSVGVYVDGVPIVRSYGLRSNLVDIAQMEVLKGPQGTLFGKNTTGGAINITTQHPTYALGGYVDILYGSYNNRQITAALNLPIVDEKIALRIVGQRIKRDGFGENVTTGSDFNNDDLWFGRALLRVDLDENLSVLLSADYSKQNVNGALNVLNSDQMLKNANKPTGALGEIASELGLDRNSAADRLTAYNAWKGYYDQYGDQYGKRGYFYDGFGNVDPFDNVRIYGFGSNIAYQSGPVRFESVTGYRALDRGFLQDYDSTPFDLFRSATTTSQRFFSQELRLSANGMKGFDWQLGLFYSRETGNEGSVINNLMTINNQRASVGDTDIRNVSKAAFAQVIYHVSPRIRVTGGIRYTRDDRWIDSHNRTDVAYAAPPTPPASFNACFEKVGGGSIDRNSCSYVASTNSGRATWLIGTDWRPVEDTMLYASISRGYRAGGFSAQSPGAVLSTQAALDTSFTPFKPETVTNYEVGLKSDLLGRRLRIAVAAFYQDYVDIQAQIRDIVNNINITLIRNAASAKLYGGEVEVTGQITPNWQATFGSSYLHAQYSKFLARDSAGNLLDLSSQPFPAPKWTYNIGTSYTLPLSESDLKASVNWRYTSAVNLRPGSAVDVRSITQPAYGLLDGRLAWNSSTLGLNIAAFGKNLTNKRYFTAASGVVSFGWNFGIPGDPRTFGVQVRKTF